MKNALITSANKSNGSETSFQLLQKGFYVYLSSLNMSKELEAAEQLKVKGLSKVEVVEIDDADTASVKAARTAINNKTDLPQQLPESPSAIIFEQWTSPNDSTEYSKYFSSCNLKRLLL